MIRKVLLSFLLLLGISVSRADLGWHTVYENDASGSVVSGSVSALIAAINKGVDIKIMTIRADGTVGSTVVPQYVGVAPNNAIVHAHYRTVSLDLNANGSAQVQSNAFDIDAVLNTNGFVSYTGYYKNGTKKSDWYYTWAIRWMIRY